MKISQVCRVKTNFVDADFWIVRKGSVESVGEAVRTFGPSNIGIKVIDERIVPGYLYYWFVHLHNIGFWKPLAHGTLNLVHIRVSDVKEIPVRFT